MKVATAIALAVACGILLVGCTTQEVPGPETTVTVTAQPTVPPRVPTDPLTDFDAFALCAARTLQPSPFGDEPVERVYNLDQVYLRDDGRWWVVIDEFDPNPNPHGHFNPDGASWSYCLLDGTIGEVEFPHFGSSIFKPGDDPNYQEFIDWG
ncbi:hypothetical protein IWX78_000010 [Mycetocola sp. CAN_C7]|uniref:hypothetical protein n=1 Tax=Mycetocola sp. CAN_C7 TaxID=2787724 RepID=UPI0018C939CD